MRPPTWPPRRPRRGERLVGPRLEVVNRFRPFALLSPGFVEVDQRLAAPGTVRTAYAPPAPFVTTEVETAGSAVRTGLTAPDGSGLLAEHDPVAGTVRLLASGAGAPQVVAERRVRRRPRRLATVLLENRVTVLVDDPARGWRPVHTANQRPLTGLDLRLPDVLGRLTATFVTQEARQVGPRARAGLFGMAGLRDLHLVQHADGTPYQGPDGRMYLTATCAGLGFFRQAHWGVFAFDPAVLVGDRPAPDGGLPLEQTAHLYSHRGRKVFGDHAGQLVRHDGRWLVAVSSWGNFAPDRTVHVRHADSAEDLLHGVHVLRTERTPMPTGRGSYDPGLTLVDGRWHVSYVESVGHQPSRFHPGLAVGPADAGHWTDGLARVGEAPDRDFCEGPILDRPEGPGTPWRLLASDGRARRFRVFDLDVREVGVLDAPYGTNLPHPQLFDLPDGGRAMVTFDGRPYHRRRLGYGTHGSVVVMRTR